MRQTKAHREWGLVVKGGALCPHQDYVYFNYPTEAESEGILGYRTRVDQAVAEGWLPIFEGFTP